MSLQIGDEAPDFEAETTEGRMRFHEWIGDSWVVLFSAPRGLHSERARPSSWATWPRSSRISTGEREDHRHASVDPIDRHADWAADIEATQGYAPNYPIIGDDDFNVSQLHGTLPREHVGNTRSSAPRPTTRPYARVRARSGPDKKIKLILVDPMTTAATSTRCCAVIDSLRADREAQGRYAVNWQHGEDVITAGSVSNDEAKEIWPDGWRSPAAYIRIVPDPS